eukprot:gene3735-4305_t
MSTTTANSVSIKVIVFGEDNNLSIEMSLNETVAALKTRIRDIYQTHPDPSTQKLIFSGKCLEDPHTLAMVFKQRDISAPQSLHLILRKPLPTNTTMPTFRPPVYDDLVEQPPPVTVVAPPTQQSSVNTPSITTTLPATRAATTTTTTTAATTPTPTTTNEASIPQGLFNGLPQQQHLQMPPLYHPSYPSAMLPSIYGPPVHFWYPPQYRIPPYPTAFPQDPTFAITNPAALAGQTPAAAGAQPAAAPVAPAAPAPAVAQARRRRRIDAADVLNYVFKIILLGVFLQDFIIQVPISNQQLQQVQEPIQINQLHQ